MDKKIKIDKWFTASHEVDPQKGFTPLCPNELPVPDGHNIADELNRQAQFARLRTVSKDVHPKNAIWLADEFTKQLTPLNLKGEINIDVAWNAHCMSGTEGAELIPGLPNITDYNFIVFKGIEPNLHPYSGVYHDLQKKISTGLIEFYDKDDIDTVILGGIALNYCVKETAIDLLNAGFRVIVNVAATRSLGPAYHTIHELMDLGIICIDSVDDLEIISTND